MVEKGEKEKGKEIEKVETLENLSLSEDDISVSDGASNIKRKKRSMQFKVPTAGKQRSDRTWHDGSSALTNLGNVRGFDEEDSDDIDNYGMNIAESFSKAKVSPKSNKLPGGLRHYVILPRR